MSRQRFFDVLQGVVSPWTLIYAEQNAPRPTKPYATLSVRSIVHPMHAVASRVDEDGHAEMTAQVLYMMDLNFFGPGAMERAHDVRAVLRYHSHIQAAHAQGLAYSTITEPVNLSALLGNQYEERAMFEVNGYALKLGSDDIGRIQRVEVSGDVGDIDGSVSIDATTP